MPTVKRSWQSPKAISDRPRPCCSKNSSRTCRGSRRPTSRTRVRTCSINLIVTLLRVILKSSARKWKYYLTSFHRKSSIISVNLQSVSTTCSPVSTNKMAWTALKLRQLRCSNQSQGKTRASLSRTRPRRVLAGSDLREGVLIPTRLTTKLIVMKSSMNLPSQWSSASRRIGVADGIKRHRAHLRMTISHSREIPRIKVRATRTRQEALTHRTRPARKLSLTMRGSCRRSNSKHLIPFLWAVKEDVSSLFHKN